VRLVQFVTGVLLMAASIALLWFGITQPRPYSPALLALGFPGAFIGGYIAAGVVRPKR
jgi:hypothetical protein